MKRKKNNRMIAQLAVFAVLVLAVVASVFATNARRSPQTSPALTADGQTSAVSHTETAAATASTESTAKTTVTQPQTTVSVTTKPATSTTIPATTKPEISSTTKPVTTKPSTTAAQTTVGTTAPKATQPAPSSGRIIVDPTKGKWNLIVVNSGREIPEGYKPKLKEILGCGKYLDYRVAPHYEDMYYAAKKDGITLTPYSAYRTYERQKINYNNLTNKYMSQYNLSREAAAKKAASVILPPGTSEHNLGLAMDICNTYDSFANSKEYAWLQKHAHEYGFILRYTKAKQPITGIVPEPWHWRYVGVEYAKKIKDSGLCLEEYLDSVGIAY